MPRRKRLTDAGIARLRPEAREYMVWDTEVRGLGVRVRSSGSRTWVYHRKTDRGVRKMSFGPAMLRKVEDVRRVCLAEAAATVEKEKGGHEEVPLFRDFVAGSWKAACYDRCKPSTQRSLRSHLKRQLLPVFGHRRLDRIMHIAVVRWFENYSVTAPGNANHALDALRQILNYARVCGYIENNPARNIRRNPGAQFNRFLSREEIQQLHRVLDDYVQGSVSESQQADVIRLLLLTGCRKGEIMRLRREEVKGDRLELTDSKTGARTVLLNVLAREIIARRVAHGNSPWVFPSVRDSSRPQHDGLPLWYAVRRKAGVQDVRLHDLRHTVASQAVLNGVPLPVVARLLGHSDVAMTMRYAHVGDAEIESAAERIGLTIAGAIGLKCLGTSQSCRGRAAFPIAQETALAPPPVA